jgi:hypothetical protein
MQDDRFEAEDAGGKKEDRGLYGGGDSAEEAEERGHP